MQIKAQKGQYDSQAQVLCIIKYYTIFYNKTKDTLTLNKYNCLMLKWYDEVTLMVPTYTINYEQQRCNTATQHRPLSMKVRKENLLQQKYIISQHKRST